MIEVDSFLIISNFNNQKEDEIKKENIPKLENDLIYYKFLLHSKLNRKKKLQKRFQKFSGILWLGRIIRNLAKLQCEKVIKTYETELSKSVGLLKKVECLDQKADAIEIKTTKEDIKIWKEKLYSVNYGIKTNPDNAKSFNQNYDPDGIFDEAAKFNEAIKHTNYFKTLIKIKKECESLEKMNVQLLKKLKLTALDLGEMENMIFTSHSAIFCTKFLQNHKRALERMEVSGKINEDRRKCYENFCNEKLKKIENIRERMSYQTKKEVQNREELTFEKHQENKISFEIFSWTIFIMAFFILSAVYFLNFKMIETV